MNIFKYIFRLSLEINNRYILWMRKILLNQLKELATNGENKSQPVASRETGLLKLKKSVSKQGKGGKSDEKVHAFSGNRFGSFISVGYCKDRKED